MNSNLELCNEIERQVVNHGNLKSEDLKERVLTQIKGFEKI